MSLFEDLMYHTGAVPDRRGEHHITCPDCTHESTPRAPHCSFNEQGWFCFSCGAGGSLKSLAERLNVPVSERPQITPRKSLQEAPRRAYPWQHDPDILYAYESHPQRFLAWERYKPLPRPVIEAKRLGVGRLPSSKCPHERLIVPVLDEGEMVGLRGRSLGCECGKWLVAAGTHLNRQPLYNQDALTNNQVVWIVENPVDALMVAVSTPFVGLASYSTSWWRAEWTEVLKLARPELVMVAYDQDLVGNGGGDRRAEFVAEWLKSHPRVPESRGIKLVNTLLAAGIHAVLFPWKDKPYKYDIGSLLMQGASV
jgi:hypothetical protein